MGRVQSFMLILGRVGLGQEKWTHVQLSQAYKRQIKHQSWLDCTIRLHPRAFQRYEELTTDGGIQFAERDVDHVWSRLIHRVDDDAVSPWSAVEAS